VLTEGGTEEWLPICATARVPRACQRARGSRDYFDAEHLGTSPIPNRVDRNRRSAGPGILC